MGWLLKGSRMLLTLHTIIYIYVQMTLVQNEVIVYYFEDNIIRILENK